MGQFSPYGIAESEPPKWKPGEDMAAAAFVGMGILLVVDINVGIWRVFKKSQGLYYWTMKLGSLACLVDAIGVILKYLTSNTKHIWGLYTVLLLGGWSIYAPAQLLVLYSRLHLINDHYKVHKWIRILIYSTAFWLIIPTWIVVWQAYDPDPKISSLWSPRDAIVERYNQIGFTVVEFVLSGIYIWSLLGLLNLKSNVRQRRVFMDLIYVNLIILSLDILTVCLVYTNRLGISHPIQTFSYAAKLKLEFVVLNQLMAVAVRGVRRTNFEERRYKHSSAEDPFTAECHEWDRKLSNPVHRNTAKNQPTISEKPSSNPAQITFPSPTLSRQQQARKGSTADLETSSISSQRDPMSKNRTSHAEELDGDMLGTKQGIGLDSYLADDDAGSTYEMSPPRHKPSEAFSGETLHGPRSNARDESPHDFINRARKEKDPTLLPIQKPPRQRRRNEADQGVKRDRKGHFTGHLTRHVPRNGRDNDDESEDEEIGVHMWENNRGKMVMEVPWFKSRNGSV